MQAMEETHSVALVTRPYLLALGYWLDDSKALTSNRMPTHCLRIYSHTISLWL